MQGVGNGASPSGTWDATAVCDCHGGGYIEALKISPAVIEHNHNAWAETGKGDIHTEPVDHTIGLMRPIHSSTCDGRATHTRGVERGEVGRIVRETSLEFRSHPSHGHVGQDAPVP